MESCSFSPLLFIQCSVNNPRLDSRLHELAQFFAPQLINMVLSSKEKEEQDHDDDEPERILHDDECTNIPDLRLIHFNDVYHPQ